MTPIQFTSRWCSEVVAKDSLPDDVQLITAPAARLASTRLPESTRQFLAQAGLPKSCAPCLCFEEVGRGLPRIWELYSPTEWRVEQKKPLESYLMLGSDGSGSPICVDERDGSVVLVDHELLFDPKLVAARIQFVNSSIPQLAESLLVIHTAPREQRRGMLVQVDPTAVKKGSFWSYEANIQPEADDADEGVKKSWPTTLWRALTKPLTLR